MFKLRLAIAFLCAVMLFPVAHASPKQAAAVPAAPLPLQITTAKRVFISYDGGLIDAKTWTGGTAQPYNEFYAAIKSWGRYEIVPVPDEADLVLQISFADPLTVVASSGAGCGSSNSPHLHLVLLDPKTHIVLWTLNEKSSITHLQKGRDQGLQQAIDNLVSDLKALTAPPATASE